MEDQEIIKAVAEKVMGWHKHHDPALEYWVNDRLAIQMLIQDWDPITDANHMMMVVEKMHSLQWFFKIYQYANEPKYDCVFEDDTGQQRGFYSGRDKSIGRAVCLAALKAVEEK